jgi:adenylate kinase
MDLGGRINCVPLVSVAAETLIQRISGRRVCRESGHVYHMVNKPPIVPGICDLDGSELYQRDDDKAETISKRMRVYFDQTRPLIEFYRQQGVLVEVDGAQPIEKVSADILAALSQSV